jgi:hypothetical protein
MDPKHCSRPPFFTIMVITHSSLLNPDPEIYGKIPKDKFV